MRRKINTGINKKKLSHGDDVDKGRGIEQFLIRTLADLENPGNLSILITLLCEEQW